MEQKCPYCGAVLLGSEDTCRSCGSPLTAGARLSPGNPAPKPVAGYTWAPQRSANGKGCVGCLVILGIMLLVSFLITGMRSFFSIGLTVQNIALYFTLWAIGVGLVIWGMLRENRYDPSLLSPEKMGSVSDDALIRTYIQELLHRHRAQGIYLVERSSAIARLVLVLVGALGMGAYAVTAVKLDALFLILESLGFFVLLVIYWRLSPLARLKKAVDQNPDRPLDEVVRENCLDDAEGRRGRLIPYLAALGFFTHMNTTYTFNSLGGSYAVSGVRLGIGKHTAEIPATYEGQRVTAVAASAFRGNEDLEEVVLPESVVSIGTSAFSGCTNLQNIRLPRQLTAIGAYAFYNCESLSSLPLPEGLTQLGEHAFNGSGLTSMELPYGFTEVPEALLAYCARLRNVVLPNTVTVIGGRAFQGCSRLETLNIPDGLTAIGTNAFDPGGADPPGSGSPCLLGLFSPAADQPGPQRPAHRGSKQQRPLRQRHQLQQQ